MAEGDVISWAQTVAKFKERYPPDVVAKSPVLTPSPDSAPNEANVGVFLEAMLTYLASVQIDVMDHRADAGDDAAAARMRELRNTVWKSELTLGSVERHLLRGPNPLGDGGPVGSMTGVSAHEVPNAALVTALWRRLKKAPKLDEIDFVAEVSQARTIIEEAYRWDELLGVLTAIRNSATHDKRMNLVTRQFTEELWRTVQQAAIELGVTGPADAVLRRFTTGVRATATYKDGVQVNRYFTPSLEMVWGYTVEKGEKATSDAVVLRFQDELSKNELGGEQYRWVVPLGPYRPWSDVLQDPTPEPPIDYTGRGEAWLSAGTVAVSSAGGQTRLLSLPVDTTVVVSSRGHSASDSERLQIGAPDPYLRELTNHSLLHAIEALNRTAGWTMLTRRSDRGIAAVVDVEGPEERCRALGVDTATVVAACRALTESRGPLPNEVQVAVARKTLGQAWHPHRDLFGWVELDGTIVDEPLPCPRADLLMLVPTRIDRRPRRVDVARVGRALGDMKAPSNFVELAQMCGETTAAMEAEEANPLVPILVPVAREFTGGEEKGPDWVPPIIVSPFNWAAGILFAHGDPARDNACRWLQSCVLPKYVEPYPASTAATPRDGNPPPR